MSDAAKANDASRDEPIRDWVLESMPNALAFARSLLTDRHAAEDVVHDCFCRLLAKREQYDLPKDGFKLLLRSITNECIDRSRRKGPKLWTPPTTEQEAEPEFVDSKTPTPAESVIQKELETRVAEAIAKLPMVQRAAIELKSLGCRLSEIAESLGVSESHAGVLVHRARQSLAKQLDLPN